MFIIKKYNEDGKKIKEIRHNDMLEAFEAMAEIFKKKNAAKAKMVDLDGKVFSRYQEFDQ